MSAPITLSETTPRWLGAPIPEPTLGDKIRGCRKLIEALKEKRSEADQELAFMEAQREAIAAHLVEAETRLTFLEEQELDERYGVPK